jgi:hypothetical protein
MPRVLRKAALLFTSMLAVSALADCSYLFPSCATVPGCPTGQKLCSNLACSDLRTDPFNCGMCNHPCGAGLVCVPDGGPNDTGACGCPIPGQILASGQCLTLSVDPNNCGAVGKACRPDQACLDGGCGCVLPSFLAELFDGGSLPPVVAGILDGGGECSADAGPVCTDLLDDTLNCGTCGRACSGACVLGSCDAGLADGGGSEAPDAGDAGEVSDAGDAGDAGSGG